MLQQEVDRLIDFVINNNIKTKTIKNLGKGRFKKTSLPEVSSNEEWIAASDARQKAEAEALAKLNKKINVVEDETEDVSSLVNVDVLPNNDEESSVDEGNEESAKVKTPSTPVKNKTPTKNIASIAELIPLTKIIETHTNMEHRKILDRFRTLISSLVPNPYVKVEMIEPIIKYYEEHKDLLDLKPENIDNATGVLAYCFKCFKNSIGSNNSSTLSASFLTKQQTAQYKTDALNLFTFQSIGVADGVVLYAIKDANGKFKKYAGSLTKNMDIWDNPNNHKWESNYYNKSTWNQHTELIAHHCGFPDPNEKSTLEYTPFMFHAAYVEEVDESMIEYDESLEDNDVPRLRSPIITDTGEPGEDPELEPVSSLEEVLKKSGDYRGGWIWLLA